MFVGRMMTLAESPLANEYIYSMNTPLSDRYLSTVDNDPDVLGQLKPITSVTLTAKWASFNTLYALSGSETITPLCPKTCVTSVSLPDLFSKKTESCLATIIYLFKGYL